MEGYIINPKTGRKIKVGGKTYNEVFKNEIKSEIKNKIKNENVTKKESFTKISKKEYKYERKMKNGKEEVKEESSEYEIRSSRKKDGSLDIGFLHNNSPMMFKTFIKYLNNDEFVEDFIDKLYQMKTDYYFESSEIKTFDSTFVIRLVPSDSFQGMELDYSSFQKQFDKVKKGDFAIFNSMSNDGTRLIVPLPDNNNSEYFINMRRFIKYADRDLVKEFFHVLASELKKAKTPLYMKTHGLAVPYFHFRLQNNDKYYETNNKDFKLIKMDLY